MKISAFTLYQRRSPRQRDNDDPTVKLIASGITRCYLPAAACSWIAKSPHKWTPGRIDHIRNELGQDAANRSWMFSRSTYKLIENGNWISTRDWNTNSWFGKSLNILIALAYEIFAHSSKTELNANYDSSTYLILLPETILLAVKRRLLLSSWAKPTLLNSHQLQYSTEI